MMNVFAPTLLNRIACPVEASNALGRVKTNGPKEAVTSIIPAIKFVDGAVSRAQS
jgi:hypothetical protein